MSECGRCQERRTDLTLLCGLMLTDRHCPAALNAWPPIVWMKGDRITFGSDPMVWIVVENDGNGVTLKPDTKANDARAKQLKAMGRKANP